MKFSSILNYTFLFALLGLLTFSACVDQDFDEPPGELNLPDITANTTIAELKARHIAGEFEAITEDIIVEGVVVSDDGDGNFFREIIFQDSTGGILIFTSASGLSNEYTRGRTIYLKAQGLTLGDFNGTMQIGAGIANNELVRIEEALLEEYIVKGVKGPDPTPVQVTVDQLETNVQNRFVNTLVEVQNVEFASRELGKPYAVSLQNINLDMEDCEGDELVLRTSGFSTFFTEIVPDGNGSLIGVFSIFGNTRQMRVRDLDDVLLTGDRCDGTSGGGGGGGGTPEPVKTLNEAFDGTSDDNSVIINGWTNVVATGERDWIGKSFDNNKYAQASAFRDDAPQMDTWMITPEIELNVDKILSFENATSFWTHDGLSILVSSDFDGLDVNGATWVDISDKARLAGENDAPNAWFESGDIDLSAYTAQGKLFIAFRYVGNKDTNTSTYRIDNVVVKDK